MANSVDPDQTAPLGAVCSGFTLFASTHNSPVMLGNYLQQTTSADDIFRYIHLPTNDTRVDTSKRCSIFKMSIKFIFIINTYIVDTQPRLTCSNEPGRRYMVPLVSFNDRLPLINSLMNPKHLHRFIIC